MSPPLLPRRLPGQPPAIALGTMNFGKRTPAPEAERIIRYALERGIRIFDTANVYNAGESERILGRALGRDRDDVVIASKVGMNRVGGKAEGLSAATIAKGITETLTRLGREQLDVYYLHAPDPHTPLLESLRALKTLVESKRIGAWAVSNYAAWQILEMRGSAHEIGLPPPCASQVLYNAVHRELDIEYFAYTARFPIHTTVYNPLAAGLLAGRHTYSEKAPKGSRFDGNTMYQRRYWTGTMFERTAELRALAESCGMSLLQLSYAFLASIPEIDSVLVGPAEVAHLEDAISALAMPLPEGVRKRIDDLAVSWAGTDAHYRR